MSSHKVRIENPGNAYLKCRAVIFWVTGSTVKVHISKFSNAYLNLRFTVLAYYEGSRLGG